jgi:hypothetical protein
MNDFDRRTLIAGASLLGAAALAKVARAGDLNPPAGPISPTGRSLTDVEPRTPVQKLSGNADFLYIIQTRGSYCLTGDIIVPPNMRAILVVCPTGNVSIDMQGFCIRGQQGGLGALTVQSAGLDYLEIDDGYIRDMSGDGIDSGNARCMECHDLHVDHCAQGIVVRNSGIVEACVVERCTSHGVCWQKSSTTACTFVCDDCDIRACGGHGVCMTGDWAQGSSSFCVCDCDCVGNTQDGLRLDCVSSGSSGASCTGSISDCRCVSNGAFGIRTSVAGAPGSSGARCKIQVCDSSCCDNALGGMRCFSLHCDVMDMVCSDNGGVGLSLDTCKGSCECCVCCRNASDGVLLTACPQMSVSECACHSNTGRGLCADGSCAACTITECDCSSNGTGFSIQSATCCCLWNTATSNGQNFAVVPTCPIAIVSGGELTTNSNPHSNYSFS